MDEKGERRRKINERYEDCDSGRDLRQNKRTRNDQENEKKGLDCKVPEIRIIMKIEGSHDRHGMSG